METYEVLAQSYVAETQNWISVNVGKIKHCLAQLDEEQIWWRPHDSMNSIANLVLHLCGNIRQRILATVGGEPDDRDRPREFTERGPISKMELTRQLEEVAGRAVQVVASQNASQLVEPRRYQGISRVFDGNVLSTILHSLTHLCGHAQEIVFVTRLQLGEAYQFQAVPPSKAP